MPSGRDRTHLDRQGRGNLYLVLDLGPTRWDEGSIDAGDANRK